MKRPLHTVWQQMSATIIITGVSLPIHLEQIFQIVLQKSNTETSPSFVCAFPNQLQEPFQILLL